MKLSITILCMASVMPMVLLAHDMSLHMKIAAETFDVWQDYDPAFYHRMITQAETREDSILKMFTYKFYYIGAMLPDLCLPQTQSLVRHLIDRLYEERGNLKDPLYIHTETKDAVQTPIQFPSASNSHNLEKLYQMVQHAKDNHWTPYQKSLIYGAYVHALHDMYATFAQASRFGYGKCYDSDSAIYYDVLRYSELYHELFSQTHMLSSWIKFIVPLYTEVADPYSEMIIRPSSCCFYRDYNISEPHNLYGWQDLDFPAVQKYVEASNSVGWQVLNLTQDRLESYLHGWAIMTFMLYGYRQDGTGCGGMFSHPDWSIDYVVDNFWYNIGSAHYEPFLLGLLPNEVQEAIKTVAWQLFHLSLGLNEEIETWLKWSSGLTEPWPRYFQTVDRLQELWDSIPDSLQTPEAQREFRRDRVNLDFWQRTAGNHILEPRLRTSYSTEPSLAVDMKNFYKTSISQGPTYLDLNWNGLKVWTAARKAGLLGGLYDVSSDVYSRQPGVIDLHYFANRSSTHDYTYSSLVTEDAPNGGVEWDLITFPNKTRIRLMGRLQDGRATQLQSVDYSINNIERKQSFLETNLDDAHLSGVKEIYWEIYTFDPNNNARLMLSADYRDAYQASPMVYNNILYQSWFSHGDPTRNQWQDPIADPLRYWPSVLRIFGLYQPQEFTNSFISSSREKLQWIDMSNREDGFLLMRKEDDEPWNETYTTIGAAAGSGSQVTYYDTVTLCHKYCYKLRAYDNQGRYSDWDSLYDIHGSVAQSNYLKMSAYNTGSMMVKHGNDVYVAYADGPWKQRTVRILHSTDNGATFSLTYSSNTQYNSHPAIAQDNAGTPYVVWCNIDWKGTEGPGGWHRCYDCVYYLNGMWNPRELYAEYLNDDPYWTPPSEDYISTPSITCSSDTGYVAFKRLYESEIKVITFLLSNPNWNYCESIALNDLNTTEHVSIAYDQGGRIAIADHKAPFGPVQLYYRGTGADHTWQSMYLPGIENDWALGSPSLLAEQNKLYVTVEGYDDGSTTDGSIYYFYLKWTKGDDTPVLDTLDTLPPNQVNKIDLYGGGGHGNIHPIEGSYRIQLLEKVDSCDFDVDGIIGYSHLAASDVILWWRNNDVWYSHKSATGWSVPQNLSNTSGVSCYPQGVTDVTPLNKRLFSLWTETIDNDCYLIRTITTYGTAPPPPPSPPGGPQGAEGVIVEQFRLENIYPNPANRTLKIRFSSPDERSVSIKLYDVTGRLVKDIFNSNAVVGVNEVLVESSHLSSGVYFLKFCAEDCNKVEKVILVR